jgi:hypothetical protein
MPKLPNGHKVFAIVLAVSIAVALTGTIAVRAAGSGQESSFVPVTPCRLFDFRPGQLPNGGKKTPLPPLSTSCETADR